MTQAPKALLLALALLLLCIPPQAAAQFVIVSGSCGELDTELTDPQPWLFNSTAEVEQCDLVSEALSAGGLEMLLDGNAGGSSLYSEIFAYELLFQCDGPLLLKTETEILYDAPGPITDALLSFGGTKIGLSVTRGLAFPFDTPLSVSAATSLLEDKLGDILVSSANVNAADAWVKQILLVATPLEASRVSLETAYAGISASLKADTIVWFVVTADDDDFLYTGDDPVCDVVVIPVFSHWVWLLLAAASLMATAWWMRRSACRAG